MLIKILYTYNSERGLVIDTTNTLQYTTLLFTISNCKGCLMTVMTHDYNCNKVVVI